MKLNLICENEDAFIVEEAIQNGVINEGILDMIDTATEVVLGAVGFIPIAGEILGDLPLVAKNLMQGDYLGAAIFLVSMEPSPFSDLVAKTLRAIQKLAKHTGQEQRLNRYIGWLAKKTGGRPTQTIVGFFDKTKNALGAVDKKVKSIDNKDPKIKKSAGVLDKVTTYIIDNLDKMKKALLEFLGMVEKKIAKMEPIGGMEDNGDYMGDLIADIKEKYHQLRKDDIENKTNNALLYKKKLLSKTVPEVRKAYEEVFGPIPEIE